MLVDFGKAGYLEKAKQQPEKVRQVLDKVKTDGIGPTFQAVSSKLNEPIPLGYSNVGTVIAIGDGVKDFAVGDRVVSNGHHAEVVVVPENLASHIPEDVDDETASFTVVSAIALQGIRLLEPTIGETFAVFGLGLIGQVAVQLLRQSGCRAIGFDLDENRVALARQFGAQAFVVGDDFDPAAAVSEVTGGIGADGALITASTKSDLLMHQAAECCRKRGRIVLTGVTGLNLRRADFYEKELTFQVSCSYGPGRYDPAYESEGSDYPLPFVRWTAKRNFDAILQLMAEGKLDVAPLISSKHDFGSASAAYEEVSGGEAIGVLLEYPQDPNVNPLEEKTVIHVAGKPLDLTSKEVCVGLIGAGGFTRSVLAPAISKSGARMKWVSSRKGLSASTLATKLDIERSTTDTSELLDDPETNTVFITPRHNSHFHFVMEALKRGRNIFVEKPLCLSSDELEEIRATYLKNPVHMMAGFNRRFAPLVVKAQELIKRRSEPLSLLYVCNAGQLPESHWLLDEAVGGGRLVGECCHFIDLLIHIVGAPAVKVSTFRQGSSAKLDVSFSVSLEFADGSIGSINYLVNGSKKFPKENLKIFSEGRVLELDNYKSLSGAGFSSFSKKRALSQDKGHNAAVKAFVSAIEQGTAPATSFESIYYAMQATFAAKQSFDNGGLEEIN